MGLGLPLSLQEIQPYSGTEKHMDHEEEISKIQKELDDILDSSTNKPQGGKKKT